MTRQGPSWSNSVGYAIGVMIGHVLLAPFKILAWAIRKAGR